MGLRNEDFRDNLRLLHLIAKKGLLIVSVRGDSMLPVLKDGDKVRILAEKYYQLGDILLFVSYNRLNLHRLVAFDNNVFVLKGDNAIKSERVLYDVVVGRMVKKVL
ncbi:MAG: S26 family signal peptidase [Clostridia bacterium]|nr:S26 family signal peptidase [Clostridia bacterium]